MVEAGRSLLSLDQPVVVRAVRRPTDRFSGHVTFTLLFCHRHILQLCNHITVMSLWAGMYSYMIPQIGLTKLKRRKTTNGHSIFPKNQNPQINIQKLKVLHTISDVWSTTIFRVCAVHVCVMEIRLQNLKQFSQDQISENVPFRD